MAHLEVKPRRRGKWWLWLILILIVIAACAYCYQHYYSGGRATSAVTDATKKTTDPAVTRRAE